MKYLLIILSIFFINNSFSQGFCVRKFKHIATMCDKEDSAFYAELDQYVGDIKMKRKPPINLSIDSIIIIEYQPILGFGKIQRHSGPYRLFRAACGISIRGPKNQLKFLIHYAIINRRFYKRHCNQCEGIKK